jgi:hypothetical protein
VGGGKEEGLCVCLCVGVEAVHASSRVEIASRVPYVGSEGVGCEHVCM